MRGIPVKRPHRILADNVENRCLFEVKSDGCEIQPTTSDAWKLAEKMIIILPLVCTAVGIALFGLYYWHKDEMRHHGYESENTIIAAGFILAIAALAILAGFQG